jgi:uncharacterized protein YchJ
LAVLAINNEINKDEFFNYLESLFSHQVFLNCNDSFIELVHLCYDIEPIKFYKQIKSAIIEEKVPSDLIGLDYFESQIELVKKGEVIINPFGHYNFINDTVKEMSNWSCFNKDNQELLDEHDGADEHDEHHHHHDGCCGTAKPVIRDNAKVGRNDPCACGSGKKYKKCCIKFH